MKKRLLYPLIFGVLSLSLSSCATQDVIAKAQGTPGPLDPPNTPPSQPNPAYYALVPLVLPFDLIFWPVEYFYMQSRTPSGPGPGVPPPGYYQNDSQYLNSPAPYRPPQSTWQ